MKYKTVFFVFLILTIVICGCTQTGTTQTSGSVQTQEEATETIMNVSTGVEDVGSTLDEIDSLLE